MTTKDIVLRAEQYANKENADFYSYAEKVAMLNESWVTVYQYLCNTGDKYWCKKIPFTGKKVTLPSDCYQISAVYRKSGIKKEQIYRYSLFNNTLTIDDDLYSSSYSYILEYYPTPKTLQFRDVIKKCPFQLGDMQDISNGKVLRYSSGYKVYDTVTKQEHATSITSRYSFIHIYDDSSIVGVNGSSYMVYYNGTTKSNLNTIVIYNNNVHYVNNGNLVDVRGNVICEWTISETGWFTTTDFTNFTKHEGVLAVNDVCITLDTNTGIANGEKSYTKYKIIGYYDNCFLTLDTLTGIYYIESEYNDTNINYPNNVFFTFLAIDMALKMRSKQGIDNVQLDSQWAIAKNALFNSIEKNKGSHVIIKDVYNYDEPFGLYY